MNRSGGFMRPNSAALILLIVMAITFMPSSIALQSMPVTFQVPRDPDPNSMHGPLGGKVECHNVGKKANCRCFRECVDGKPGRDKKCGNRCFEDKCKCRSKCQT